MNRPITMDLTPTLDLTEGPAARRARIATDITARTGITLPIIEAPIIDGVVREFYARIRLDLLLGSIFSNRNTAWEPQLLKMVEFWSSAILISGRYHGHPMAKHRDLAVTVTHFDRWLSVFRDTLRDLCPPAAQLHFGQTAERIAFSLARGIAGHAATPVPVVVSTGDPR